VQALQHKNKGGIAMSVSYSLIELLGYLGHDPQPLRHSQSGTTGARFSLAVNRVWTDEAGQRREDTDWFTVTAWGQVAESCLSYLSKGSLIFVTGKPRVQRWVDKKGGKREQVQVLADQVIFLDKPGSGEDREK
jgi:single-strand DNA-binding protein